MHGHGNLQTVSPATARTTLARACGDVLSWMPLGLSLH